MKRVLFLASLMGLQSFSAAAEPRPDHNAITLPTFIFEQRHAITAGVAFVLEESGKRFLVTAYHVLGPPGGLKSKIMPREVPREVKAVAGLCLGDMETVVLGAPFLLVEDAKAFDADGAERDVAFAVYKGDAKVKALKLSATKLEVGIRVWLFARLMDRDRPALYPAEVTELSSGTIQFRMDDSNLNLRALSGAPVLDAGGGVVGMHLGFGTKDGALIGAAAPAPAIKERLATAVARMSEE